MKSEKWQKSVCIHDWKYFWHVLFMPPNNVSHDLQQVKVTMFKEKNQQHFILCKVMKIYKSKQNSYLQKHLREGANSHKEEFSQGCLDYKTQTIALQGEKKMQQDCLVSHCRFYLEHFINSFSSLCRSFKIKKASAFRPQSPFTFIHTA